MSPPRVALVLPNTGEPWYRENLRHGFNTLAVTLARADIRTTLLGETADLEGAPRHANIETRSVEPDGVPTYVGPGPSTMTEGMRFGYRVARQLEVNPPDLVLAPLRFGVAQPLAMARATCEAFPNTQICIWGDAPTASRIAASDEAMTDPALLVSDALERTALNLADAVIVATESTANALGKIAPANLFCHHISLLVARPDPTRRPSPPIEEICFVGDANQNRGIRDFLDAVEKLGRQIFLSVDA